MLICVATSILQNKKNILLQDITMYDVFQDLLTKNILTSPVTWLSFQLINKKSVIIAELLRCNFLDSHSQNLSLRKYKLYLQTH